MSTSPVCADAGTTETCDGGADVQIPATDMELVNRRRLKRRKTRPDEGLHDTRVAKKVGEMLTQRIRNWTATAPRWTVCPVDHFATFSTRCTKNPKAKIYHLSATLPRHKWTARGGTRFWTEATVPLWMASSRPVAWLSVQRTTSDECESLHSMGLCLPPMDSTSKSGDTRSVSASHREVSWKRATRTRRGTQW